MKTILKANSMMILIVFTVLLIGSTGVGAGTKDMVATKKSKFKDDNAVSMKDVLARRDSENKKYKETMLLNSNKTVKLLNEIKDLLVQFNKKEK